MILELRVPSIVCEGCVETITKELKKNLPEAKVEINLETKMVSVDTRASEAEVKEIIIATGHTVE
ncbi:heavy-metal-associated domain-containing protein [Gloeocapsa sp. PCC 73106]|uniref:heavy-metal-associated domain-containing protein n=1 Tax=Gloeocapsa sp. PCC 73106 TaxID=102232 RepID=UPI0002AC271B|nr:heavy-metal-associated domain-containing protein [Gloeocapsa sp. PCC 73106]ELR98543.1 copper chaperone [Gloeocapsa sp. PCC 73106]